MNEQDITTVEKELIEILSENTLPEITLVKFRKIKAEEGQRTFKQGLTSVLANHPELRYVRDQAFDKAREYLRTDVDLKDILDSIVVEHKMPSCYLHRELYPAEI